MSKRRSVGDIVRIHDDEEGFYLGRISARGEATRHECPQMYLDSKHDRECREWPNIEVLDSNEKPTGQFAYHISECEMSDPAGDR